MRKKVPIEDEYFERFARLTAKFTRRGFISRICGAGVFLLTFGRSSGYSQEAGCPTEPVENVCCCFGITPYDCPPETWNGCCYGMVNGVKYTHIIDTRTQQCCGVTGPIPKSDPNAQPPIIWECCEYNCSYYPLDHPSYPGLKIPGSCTNSAGYKPSIQGCCNDGVFLKALQDCCSEKKKYNKYSHCCCPDGTLQPCTGYTEE